MFPLSIIRDVSSIFLPVSLFTSFILFNASIGNGKTIDLQKKFLQRRITNLKQNNMDVYTLKIKKNTTEYHLFRGNPVVGGCTTDQKSICKEMDKNESSSDLFKCMDEDSARIKCAQIGRRVCGTCVSHLYETY